MPNKLLVNLKIAISWDKIYMLEVAIFWDGGSTTLDYIYIVDVDCAQLTNGTRSENELFKGFS